MAGAAAVLPGPAPSDLDVPAPPAPLRPLADRWLNLPALITLAALDDTDRRCRCIAPTADQCGFHPSALPALTAAEIARCLHAATAHPHLAAALATVCFTAASTTQLA
jgi:hypothetical protein